MWENIKVMFEMELLKRDMNQVYNVKETILKILKILLNPFGNY